MEHELKTKKIKSKEIKRKDVLVAVDIAKNDIDFLNLKQLLNLFDQMTNEYDMICKVLLFDNEIRSNINIENIDTIDKDSIIISTAEKADFNSIIEYADKNKLDIFKIFTITSGDLILPDDCKYPVTWISDSNCNFNFGERLTL